MVFLSGVSLAAGVLASVGQSGLTAPLRSSAADAADKTAFSVKYAGSVLGRGIIISPEGYAITTGDVAFDASGNPKKGMEAVQGARTISALSVKGFDPVTDLALVKLREPGPYAFAVIAKDDSSNVVMTSLMTGMVRAEVSRRSVVGVMDLTQRFVPLVELRLESGALILGGAPVFSPDGGLVGILQASLGTTERPTADMNSKAIGSSLLPNTQGPRPLVTGFSVSTVALKRVVDGFLSEDRAVRHPYIGLYFSTYDQGGALVGEVTKGGPADRAELFKGDVIIQAGDRPIITAVDLATYLFNLKIGESVSLTIRRAYMEKIVKVKVEADPRPVVGENITRKRGLN